MLLNAIRADADPAHLAFMEEVIEGEIGQQLVSVLEERALVAGLADPAANEKIRDLMERSACPQAAALVRGGILLRRR